MTAIRHDLEPRASDPMRHLLGHGRRGDGVGWVSMALYALVYRQYPAAAESRFAIPHFWVANIGAVLLTVGISTQMVPLPSLAFIVISGSLITILGMLMFTGIVYSKV